MTFRTTADIVSHAFNLSGGGQPLGDAWTLPAGSRVQLVKGFHGGGVDGFAAADVAQLKALSGNSHDPVYRYMHIRAAVVEAVGSDDDAATVARLQALEA